MKHLVLKHLLLGHLRTLVDAVSTQREGERERERAIEKNREIGRERERERETEKGRERHISREQSREREKKDGGVSDLVLEHLLLGHLGTLIEAVWVGSTNAHPLK